MNENHNHDKAMEDAIERVVHGKKASGDALMDALGQTSPKADPAFIANLEERLMAEFSTTKTKKELAMLKRKEKPGRFGRWPLTMAAAVIAILLVGGLVIFTQQKPMETANADNPTATAIPMVPVVIAIQDISKGVEITPAMVDVILYPAEVAPTGAFPEVNSVIGYFAATNIYAEEIVLARKLLENSEPDVAPTASVGRQEPVSVMSNAPDVVGCSSDTKLFSPINGQIINAAITIEASTFAERFGQAKLEISGPSTNSEYIVLTTMTEALARPSEIGQFVPAQYEEGEYRLRLGSFDIYGNQTGLCNITIYISDDLSLNEGELQPVVIAVRDIPMTATITEDMVSLVYWSPELAREYTAENRGQWYATNLEDVIGLKSQVYVPAFEPVSRDDVSSDFGCDETSDSCRYPIPNDYIGIIYQTTDLAIMNFPTGAHVDVVTAMLFSDIENGVLACQGCEAGTNLVMQRTISDAIILHKELINPDGNQEVVATLAVREQEANVLLWMDEAGLPIMLVPHMEGIETSVAQSQSFNPAAEAPYYVAIPINQIESVEYGIMTGDSVNVYLNSSEMSFGGIVSYVGDSQYAPAEMQSTVDSITQGNKDVLILAVSSADIVAATNDYTTNGLSFEMVRVSSSGGTAPSNHQFPTNEQWFDASALSFNVGDNVDVIAQFTYLNENGEPEGMIRQRMGVDMIITSMEAGTGESEAYALVGLTEQNLEAGQILSSFQTCCHGTGNTRVLESWILVPYNPNLPAATQYFGYNQRGEAVPHEADALAQGHHYAALPTLFLVESAAGGFSVGDNVRLIYADGNRIDAQISYIGSAIYAPFAMQESVDSFRAESPRAIVVEVSSPEEAAAINARVEAGESVTIDPQR
jgi:Flp pilus assembly protein CpaB